MTDDGKGEHLIRGIRPGRQERATETARLINIAAKRRREAAGRKVTAYDQHAQWVRCALIYPAGCKP